MNASLRELTGLGRPFAKFGVDKTEAFSGVISVMPVGGVNIDIFKGKEPNDCNNMEGEFEVNGMLR